MFTEGFASFVCPGDVITCEIEGFTVSARIIPDDCPDPPDQRQDGFWPSLYKDAPGFIGPGNNFRARFARAQAEAEAIMEGWRKGEWFYCGIVLSVSLDGVELAPHAASLWGIEANYPETDNSSLTEVAGKLLPEALAAAREVLARLATLAPDVLAGKHRES
ncbi:hypothetical protein HPO_04875 [Hyphomonas polymorpha PS728]|uniref:Uncharacterized protein n=1 Tax=Hyphomonas polymorpha PS728 TaxID=1280954 RepID=A0A062VBA8_9PROT|nr:hypothetical protein [Hyphomonas polymorpha]KCZ99692.1 hypothetical protein HPO_04875 [Hyphomonas polymorpha PS728]